MNATAPHQHLCPVIEHPELDHLDDSGIRFWADAHGLTLHRDWRGLLCTNLDDAYKLRAILDADTARQAAAITETERELAAQHDAATAPLKRRLEANVRRQEILAGLDSETSDERVREWDSRLSEIGDAGFLAPLLPPEPDHRTAVERLKDKVLGR